MPDYKAMYFHLFNRISDVIETLKLAQQETEELFISSDRPAITFLDESRIDNSGGDSESF